MITTQDKELLAKKGITEAQIAEQLACFQTGFPYLKLDAAASIEKGILAPDAEEKNAYLAAWDAYKNTDKIIVKFVPASGAASRMFKNLFEFLSAEYDKPTTKFEQAFFDGIKDFAFYDDLNVACQRTAGKDIPGLMEEGNYKAVVAALLETAGLNYGALPKGLLKFHKYPEGSRTPLEEHLAEGAMYAAGKSYNEIIDALGGLRGKRGAVIGKTQLKSILQNERYIGTYTWNKKQYKVMNKWAGGKPNPNIVKIEGVIPPLVDIETWERVRVRMADRKRNAKNKAKREYLLSGLITCDCCGGHYVGHTSTNSRGYQTVYYTCGTKYRNHTCNSSFVA